jgi:hypothetical protein
LFPTSFRFYRQFFLLCILLLYIIKNMQILVYPYTRKNKYYGRMLYQQCHSPLKLLIYHNLGFISRQNKHKFEKLISYHIQLWSFIICFVFCFIFTFYVNEVISGWIWRSKTQKKLKAFRFCWWCWILLYSTIYK